MGMTTLLVRDANENHRAQAILTGPRGHEISDVVYAGWPRLVFDSDVRLDLVRCAGNLEASRLAAEHNYCLIRYGSPDRRRMTDADRMAVRISAFVGGTGSRCHVRQAGLAGCGRPMTLWCER